MENRQQMNEMEKRTEKSSAEFDERMQKRMEKSSAEFDERLAKSSVEFDAKLDKVFGGFGNSLGRMTEAIFLPKLYKKFDELGFRFNTQANHKKYYENDRCIAEADSILENGEYIMLVEIKTKLSIDDVNDHLERIKIIRKYMDTHGDNRKIVGAAAGGYIAENVMNYTQNKGLYVIVQTGESVAVADMPQNFKAREW
jgi:hypothetical protein